MDNNVEVVAVPKLKTYTKLERNTYLTSLLGQNMIYNIIGAGLGYFLQFTLVIPALAVSIIMAIARVWDAINDPMMGTIVDRTRSKWGKCRPYLLFVPIPIFIITILCFTNFGFYDAAGNTIGQKVWMIAWAAITYILWGMTYTIGDIPLWGITALMTEDDKDRNKLLALCRLFGGLGGGITLLGFQPIALMVTDLLKKSMASNEAEKLAFFLTALGMGLIATVMFQIGGFFVREKIAPSTQKYGLKDNFKIMWRNKPFRQILLSGILGSPKMLIALCAMPLVTYYYASKNGLLALLYMALLGGGLFVGQFVAMALTPKLITKFSKKNLYNYSNLLGVLPYFLIFICYLIDPMGLTKPFWLVIMFMLFAVVGISMGITTVLQSLMIADCIDYEEYTNGIRPDAVFFSGQSFITKLSMGIATIVSGIAYTIVGFSDSEVTRVNDYIDAKLIPKDNPEFSSYMMILFLLVSIPPAIGCLLTVIPTWKYALDDDEHKRILLELNIKRDREETVAIDE